MAQLHYETISIKVICDDTDVFLLLVHFYSVQKLACNLAMAGTSAGRSVIDIKKTVRKQVVLCEQLLGAHALSGCDAVSLPG